MSVFTHALLTLAHALTPLTGRAAAPAAAIVLVTLLVRLALHPLARAAARGEKARAALAPHVAELRRKHARDPQALQRALSGLYARQDSSPFAGILPTLLQLPAFFVLYHASSTARVAGDRAGALHIAILAVVAAVAYWSYRRARKAAPAAEGLAKHLPLLSFGTLVTAAVVPPAAGIYIATSTAWTTAERAWLHRPQRGQGVAAAPSAATGSTKDLR